MVATRSARQLVRIADGAGYLRLLALAGITTVLLTRAYLGLTGYPQVGSGTLHIAHVLWGGLLMLAGLMSALLFVGGGARTCTAVLGGVGLGLFADEVGKFITRTNDYFFRPAAAIIYLVFASLLVLASRLRRRPAVDAGERLASAAQIASAAMVSGLTVRQRDTAQRLLAGQDDDAARAIRQLLATAPHREPPALARYLLDRPLAAAKRLLDRPWFSPTVLWLFVASRTAVAAVFIVQALILATGHRLAPGTENGALLASAVTRTLALALAVAGLRRWREDWRAAYGWFKMSALVGLLLTQVFNFTDSQFRAVAELPFDLLVLALVTYRLQRPDAGNLDRFGRRDHLTVNWRRPETADASPRDG